MEQTSYSNISADGNARQHNGHIYNNTSNYSASGEARQHIGNVSNNWNYYYTLRKRKSDDTLKENERSQALLSAAAEGQRPRLNYLLSRGVNVDWSDDAGFTALHHACLSGFEDVVQILLEAGADVNAQSVDFGTPLCLAALRGRRNVARLLHNYRVDVNKTGLWIGTPLHCACYIGSVEVAATLLESGAKLSITCTIREEFLEYGYAAHSATYQPQPARKAGGKCRLITCDPFYLAAGEGHETVVAFLLEAHQDVDSLNCEWDTSNPAVDTFADVADEEKKSQITTLMKISELAYPKIVAMLASCTANLEMKDSQGHCALAYATRSKQSGSLDCVRALVEAKVDVNSRDTDLNTPLFLAVSSSNLEISRYLLDHGAEINVCNQSGDTPCHVAATTGDVDIMRVLLERNPDLSARNSLGFTPLHEAVFEEHVEMVECLLQANANPSGPSINGFTPLHFAVGHGYIEIVRLLLEWGASVTIKDNSGKTAADYCVYGSVIKNLLIPNVNHPRDLNASAQSDADPIAPAAVIARTTNMLQDVATLLLGSNGVRSALDAGILVKDVREQLLLMEPELASSGVPSDLQVEAFERIFQKALNLRKGLAKLNQIDKTAPPSKVVAATEWVKHEYKIQLCVSELESSLARLSNLWVSHYKIENHPMVASLERKVAELTEQNRALMERPKELERISKDTNDIQDADHDSQEESRAESLWPAERAQSVPPRLLLPTQDNPLQDFEISLERKLAYRRSQSNGAESQTRLPLMGTDKDAVPSQGRTDKIFEAGAT